VFCLILVAWLCAQHLALCRRMQVRDVAALVLDASARACTCTRLALDHRIWQQRALRWSRASPSLYRLFNSFFV
jgi:hypothetical protein